jgi:hypothetical protein
MIDISRSNEPYIDSYPCTYTKGSSYFRVSTDVHTEYVSSYCIEYRECTPEYDSMRELRTDRELVYFVEELHGKN